jgi:hypothetical protein
MKAEPTFPIVIFSFFRTCPSLLSIAYVVSVITTSAQDLTRGKMEFLTMCASCHGDDGKGAGPKSISLKSKPADLTALARRNGGVFTPGAVLGMIDGRKEPRSHVISEMPIWGCRAPSASTNANEPNSVQSFSDLACDPEPVIQNRLRNIVEYLRTVQVD